MSCGISQLSNKALSEFRCGIFNFVQSALSTSSLFAQHYFRNTITVFDLRECIQDLSRNSINSNIVGYEKYFKLDRTSSDESYTRAESNSSSSSSSKSMDDDNNTISSLSSTSSYKDVATKNDYGEIEILSSVRISLDDEIENSTVFFNHDLHLISPLSLFYMIKSISEIPGQLHSTHIYLDAFNALFELLIDHIEFACRGEPTLIPQLKLPDSLRYFRSSTNSIYVSFPVLNELLLLENKRIEAMHAKDMIAHTLTSEVQNTEILKNMLKVGR